MSTVGKFKRTLLDFGLTRIIIIFTLLILLSLASFYDMNIPRFLSDILTRWGTFGILILAMVPGIQSGIGPNFGITVGITSGLLGAVLSLELRFRGFFDAFIVEPYHYFVTVTEPLGAIMEARVYTEAGRWITPVVTFVEGHWMRRVVGRAVQEGYDFIVPEGYRYILQEGYRFLIPDGYEHIMHEGYNFILQPFEVQFPSAPMFNLVGLATIFMALIMGILFSTVAGILYGMLLNRVKGSEMAISAYVGFSVVALFNIVWFTLPVSSGILILPARGSGMRQMINLQDDFGDVFNRIFQFDIPLAGSNLTIPTGLLLVLFLLCWVVWLFTRSRLGMMMSAAGSNPEYAKASGINVNKMRIIGTMLSTVLGAVGIIVYASSFGFIQLYNAPLMMGFATVAAVLIGGATVRRARVSDALIGALLFHSMLAIALPLANRMLPGVAALPEIFRVIITNGIILFALSRAKGA
ncbi:MAG: hypothetical protein FWC78_06625 [Defluviitaleaceae bacterium]|nr:hypothetical protein [Defluviitaleaceae bacterium]